MLLINLHLIKRFKFKEVVEPQFLITGLGVSKFRYETELS